MNACPQDLEKDEAISQGPKAPFPLPCRPVQTNTDVNAHSEETQTQYIKHVRIVRVIRGLRNKNYVRVLPSAPFELSCLVCGQINVVLHRQQPSPRHRVQFPVVWRELVILSRCTREACGMVRTEYSKGHFVYTSRSRQG